MLTLCTSNAKGKRESSLILYLNSCSPKQFCWRLDVLRDKHLITGTLVFLQVLPLGKTALTLSANMCVFNTHAGRMVVLADVFGSTAS